MSVRDEIINDIIDIEGGYVNDPSDSGGETNFGITRRVALAYGFKGKMKDLPRELAFQIYTTKYWSSVQGFSLENISTQIAREVVDTAINMGSVRASLFLQRVINVLSPNKIQADGVIGAVTISALRLVVKRRGEALVLKALNCLQGAFYIRLAEKRTKDKRFIAGWLTHRVKF